MKCLTEIFTFPYVRAGCLSFMAVLWYLQLARAHAITREHISNCSACSRLAPLYRPQLNAAIQHFLNATRKSCVHFSQVMSNSYDIFPQTEGLVCAELPSIPISLLRLDLDGAKGKIITQVLERQGLLPAVLAKFRIALYCPLPLGCTLIRMLLTSGYECLASASQILPAACKQLQVFNPIPELCRSKN